MQTLSPDAVDVAVRDSHTLAVSFSNGERRLFDLTPLLERKCYARLNDPVFLSSVSVQNGCVTWLDDIDIDPEWLYEDSVPAASYTWSDVARAYFKHHRVFSYRLKAVSVMTDDEVVQKCHWWQEDHHMVDDYWAFVKAHFPELA